MRVSIDRDIIVNSLQHLLDTFQSVPSSGRISYTGKLCLDKYHIHYIYVYANIAYKKTMSEQLSHTRQLCGQILHRNILSGRISPIGSYI